MRIRITLQSHLSNNKVPINYQYPLSAAIYKILQGADRDYADFLHEKGYRKPGSRKAFKLFTFSDLKTPFSIAGDRMCLKTDQAELIVSFHLPQTAEMFIKGLFLQQQMDIADKKSKASFLVKSAEMLPDALLVYKQHELVNLRLKPISPVVARVPNEKGSDDYLDPDNPLFVENLIYNWRSKIKICYSEATALSALLLMEVISGEQPFKSRLITIKAGTKEETKIRGWMNFGLMVTAEKRFVELLLNAGLGAYNAQGMGCVTIAKQALHKP